MVNYYGGRHRLLAVSQDGWLRLRVDRAEHADFWADDGWEWDTLPTDRVTLNPGPFPFDWHWAGFAAGYGRARIPTKDAHYLLGVPLWFSAAAFALPAGVRVGWVLSRR